MSDSISKPSPISGSASDKDDLTVDLDLGFDGAEDILRTWRKGMRPDPDLTVSEWADAHRWLSSRAAAEPGRYRTARALRSMEDNLLGESMSDVHALVSREFFDKLIAHPKTEEAYKFYAATGAQPLRQDVRRNFPFVGIVFEDYSGTVTLSTKATERLVPASEGIAFPLGTMDTFIIYGGPANLLEAANTMGLPLYARQHLDEKGRWIDLMTEASILPVNKRPRIAIRIHTSN